MLSSDWPAALQNMRDFEFDFEMFNFADFFFLLLSACVFQAWEDQELQNKKYMDLLKENCFFPQKH